MTWQGGLRDTEPTLLDEAQEYLDEIHARLQAEADKPLLVAVMGQPEPAFGAVTR